MDRDKQEIGYTIAISVFYIALLIFGFVCYYTNLLRPLVNCFVKEADAEKAGIALSDIQKVYIHILGFSLFAIMPTVFYYFASQNTFDWPVFVRVILFVVGAGLSCVMIWLFFEVCDRHGAILVSMSNSFITDTFAFKFSVITGHICFLIYYIFFIIPMSSNMPEKIYDIVEIGKSLPFQFIFSAIGTIFYIFIAMGLLVVIVAAGFFIVYYGSWYFFAGALESHGQSQHTTQYSVIQDGSERSLTYFSSDSNRECYRDDTGSYWYSDDHGKTFYQDK